jgi:hypothetical protein
VNYFCVVSSVLRYVLHGMTYGFSEPIPYYLFHPRMLTSYCSLFSSLNLARDCIPSTNSSLVLVTYFLLVSSIVLVIYILICLLLGDTPLILSTFYSSPLGYIMVPLFITCSSHPSYIMSKLFIINLTCSQSLLPTS